MSLENLSPQDRALYEAGRALFNHPELSKDAKRLLKKADPKVSFPELDLEDALAAEREARRADNEKRDNEQRERDIKHARERKHDDLKARGYDPIAVEKVMTDNKIMDYEAAVRFIDATTRMAAPTPASLTPSSLPDNKDLWKNPAQNARKVAHEAMNELIAKRGSIA